MINDNQHIPSGYKSSPLGIIPEDWEVKRLKETGEIYSGGTPSTDIQEYWNGNIDWCTPTDITSLNGAMYINKTAQKITEDGLKNSSAVLMPPNSIIVCTRATIGNAAISLHQISTNQGFKNIVPNKDIDFIFLYYTIINNKTRLIRLGNGSTFLEVSKSDFENLTIPVPPLPEQQRIVSVLSLWDTAIAKQTALIEKLTLRKRGLMQQLLTGKKRLKGFEGEWKKCAIKSFAKEVSTRNTNNKDYVVLSCTKYDGLVPSLEYFGKQIYSNDLSTYKVVPKNHFAYATNHIEEGSIGYQAQYNNGLISPMYTVFETDKEKVDDTYLFAVLKSHHLIYLYQAMMEGSINRRGGLRWDSFSTIKVNLPSLEEQKAISGFLQRSDKEIEIQKQKLATLQEQKKGLMQVLLTGKKRV